MSNEIKQGDKVRVSKDAPKIYTKDGFNLATKMDFEVVEIEDECARIENADGILTMAYVLPIKYLVKVDAEAKEPKYPKDDKVCINNSSIKHGLRGEILTIIGVDVSDRTYYVQSRCMRSPIWLREDEISPYTEPTEQTEEEEDARIRQMEAELDEFRKEEIDRVLHPEKPTFEVTIDDVAMNWQRYEADLAKEIVLKTVNSASDRRPMAIAEYATDVAKAVVEGLKRK